MRAPEVHRISGDITRKIAKSLNAGDRILYSGIVLTARDAAHKRLVEALDAGEQPPIDIDGAVIYYAGPAPAKPGYAIGPVGPTCLLDLGQRAMIGKGARSQEVIGAVMRNEAVYFAAIGGAAALIAQSVKSADIVAYDDLGTEAIRRLEVVDMPLTVAIDCHGGNIYETGPKEYLASST